MACHDALAPDPCLPQRTRNREKRVQPLLANRGVVPCSPPSPSTSNQESVPLSVCSPRTLSWSGLFFLALSPSLPPHHSSFRPLVCAQVLCPLFYRVFDGWRCSNDALNNPRLAQLLHPAGDPMRNSASLPRKQAAVRDPHEKPDRYNYKARGGNFVAKMKDSWASQSQRSRWLKMGAIAMFLICLFYWFAPSGAHAPSQGSSSQWTFQSLVSKPSDTMTTSA